jgi:hypothetical protein
MIKEIVLVLFTQQRIRFNIYIYHAINITPKAAGGEAVRLSCLVMCFIHSISPSSRAWLRFLIAPSLPALADLRHNSIDLLMSVSTP